MVATRPPAATETRTQILQSKVEYANHKAITSQVVVGVVVVVVVVAEVGTSCCVREAMQCSAVQCAVCTCGVDAGNINFNTSSRAFSLTYDMTRHDTRHDTNTHPLTDTELPGWLTVHPEDRRV